MIGVMAFMVFAMMIVGLLLMAIAGCVIELICSREEAQEIKEEMRHKERNERRAALRHSGRRASTRRPTPVRYWRVWQKERKRCK